MIGIGDFARLGRVSVRMLRHYDALGLLRPAHVDEGTGHRGYEIAQLSRLNRVLALKDLGFTLQQVGAILDETVGLDELRGMLRLRRAELEAAVAADLDRLARVQARLSMIEHDGRLPAEEVVVRAVPAVRVAALDETVDDYEGIPDVIGPLFGELRRRLDAAGTAATGPGTATFTPTAAGVRVRAAQPVTGMVTGVPVVDLPAVRAATFVHRGPLTDAAVVWQDLGRWVQANGHRAAGESREVYLHHDHQGGHGECVTEFQEALAADPTVRTQEHST
ncbi:MAG TPA: MerR family transcriptional regulator [Pseudonocardiaceae bacterium]